MTAVEQTQTSIVPLNSVIGPYTIKRFLGAGAWKQTFEAQRRDGTRWALKFYAPSDVASAIAAEKGISEETFWRKECRNGNNGSDYLTSSVIEEIDELRFQAEELLDETLEERLSKRRDISEEEKVDIALRLAQGLAEFQRRFHVPHGDVKPANIGFSGRKVKLFDYGTATVHMSGRGADTPYRAPETYETAVMEPLKTDIWSYGAVVYRLLTGKDIEITASDRTEINKQVKQQLKSVKNRRWRNVLKRCLDAYESSRIRGGTELKEEIEDIVRKNELKYRVLNVVRPAVRYFSVVLATGIIVGQCQDSITNPHPPVRLELPTVEAQNKDYEAVLAEGFSVLYQEERQGLIDKLLNKRKQPLPPVIFGMEDLVYGPLPTMLTIGNEVSVVTEYQHTAALINAYENTRMHLGLSIDRTDSYRIGSYVLTDYQMAMYISTENTSNDPYGGRRLLAKILTRNTAQLAEQREGGAYVDLEDVCTSSIVGTTLMYQAMLAAQESSVENFRDFSGYIDAQYPNGEYIIPHERTVYRDQEEPISVADFLKVFVQYAHQSAVPAQDFQPLVLSE